MCGLLKYYATPCINTFNSLPSKKITKTAVIAQANKLFIGTNSTYSFKLI